MNDFCKLVLFLDKDYFNKTMNERRVKRRTPKRKVAPKRKRKPVGKARRRADMVVTRRKRDHKKALAKINTLKRSLRLAEKSATKKKNEVLSAQKRASNL